MLPNIHFFSDVLAAAFPIKTKETVQNQPVICLLLKHTIFYILQNVMALNVTTHVAALPAVLPVLPILGI